MEYEYPTRKGIEGKGHTTLKGENTSCSGNRLTGKDKPKGKV